MNYKSILLSASIILSAEYTPVTFAMEPIKKQEQNKQQVLMNLFFDACRKGLDKNVAHFIQLGVDVNAPDSQESTALHLASQYGHTSIVETLLDNGATIDSLAQQSTPLHRACWNGHRQTAWILIKRGANKEAKDDGQTTPMHRACQKGNVNIVKLLINEHANKEAKDNSQSTPLMRACENGFIDVVELLIKNGANIHAKNFQDNTALHAACQFGHVAIARLLLDSKAIINAENFQKATPLHFACQFGQKLAVIMLINNPATNINAETYTNATPLHLACQNGQTEITRLLLKKDVFVNAATIDGYTPLHIAVANGHIQIIKILLAARANINAEANLGVTPLDIAYDKQNEVIISLLTHSNVSAITTQASSTELKQTKQPQEIILSKKQIKKLRQNQRSNEIKLAQKDAKTMDSSMINDAVVNEVKIEGNAETQPIISNDIISIIASDQQQEYVTSNTELSTISMTSATQVHDKAVVWQPNLIIENQPQPESKRVVISNGDDSLQSLSWSEDEDRRVIINNGDDSLQSLSWSEDEDRKVIINNEDDSLQSLSWSEDEARNEEIISMNNVSTPIIAITPINPETPISISSPISSINNSSTIIITSPKQPLKNNQVSKLKTSKSTIPVITSPKQQPKNNQAGKLKTFNNSAQITQPIHINNEYQVGHDEKLKWPRSLNEDQEKIMRDHLRMLKSWPKTLGLDTKELKGQEKGTFRLRIGKYRIIFAVDEKNRVITIYKIELRKCVYKNMNINLTSKKT